MRTRFPCVSVILAAPTILWAASFHAFEAADSGGAPLAGQYATFSQPGLKPFDSSVDPDDLAEISAAVEQSQRQVVLCVGTEVAAAVKNSRSSFSALDDPRPAIQVAPHDTVWLAAYLGSEGSVPPAYRVRAVQVSDKTIRICYERDASPVRSCDLLAYLVWVPLGRLETAMYTLELFDVATQEVTSQRNWNVVAE